MASGLIRAQGLWSRGFRVEGYYAEDEGRRPSIPRSGFEHLNLYLYIIYIYAFLFIIY